MDKNLKLIYDYQREITVLGQIGSLLLWDQLTYMPLNGANSRSEQMGLISGLIHKKTVADELFNALKILKNNKLQGRNRLVVDKLYKYISRSRKLPESFVSELSKTTTLAYQAWDKAKAEDNFNIFKPYLEKIVKLKQQECEYIREKGHLYNSLLDHYEEGMTVEKLKPVFAKLKKDLIVLLGKIKKSDVYKKQKVKLLDTNVSVEVQRRLSDDVVKKIGLRREFIRLDLSTHPFMEKIGFGDIRLTTNFRKNPLFSFGSTIHESGHALYELNLSEKDAYNVLGSSASLGMHESQSRIWENNIGKSEDFWKYYYPVFKKELKLKGSFDQMYKEVNLVKPSLIRIEADEITYCLHVILRFEIELGLIEGSIKVKDLPMIWNEKMKESLGVVPKTDKEGVLQDMHWSGGNIGYFPTYAIGSIYAAQLYIQLLKEKKGIEKQISNGNFSEIGEWLKNKVHSKGSIMKADDIIKKVCGKGLNPDDYINYLNKKYSKVYKL